MKKSYVVSKQFRTNDLSFIDGGSTVSVFLVNGENRIYDNVKNVKLYVSKIKKNRGVVKILVNNLEYWVKLKKINADK